MGNLCIWKQISDYLKQRSEICQVNLVNFAMHYTFPLLCSLPFAQLINRTWQDTFGQCDALSPFPEQELEGHRREAIEGKEAEAMGDRGVAAAGSEQESG